MGKVKPAVFLALLILAAAVMAGCGASGKADTEWKTYSADDYEFEYPGSWEIADIADLKVEQKPELLLYAAKSKKDKFLVNANLMIEQHPDLAPTAKEYADSTSKWFEETGPSAGYSNYQLLDFTPCELGNVEAGIVLAEYTISESGITVMSQQLVAPVGQQSYYLTLTCKKDDWDVYQDDFQRMIASFKLK